MRAKVREGLLALGAALLATGLMAVGRFAWEGPLLPELMATKLFAWVPPWLFTPLFRLFGYNAKYYAFAGMVAGYVGAMTALGVGLRAWWRGRLGLGRIGVAWGVLWLVTAGAVVPLLDGGVFGTGLPAGGPITSATLGAVLAVYVAVLTMGGKG